MAPRFESFVILAEMRTGSNLLEATLGQVDGLTCHGEVYNPQHMGGPNVDRVLGVSMADRIADPHALWDKIRAQAGLNGIRFFHDHEPRILATLLDDPVCAKIVLTRNPVDCYVSLKIATATKKWRLGDVRDKVAWAPAFNAEEFDAFLAARTDFQRRILRALQVSGQTAFYLDYEDSQDVGVINGLLAFLGVPGRIDRIADSLVRQNPEEMSQKVRNFPEMEAALARVDWADLSRTPNFEPRRGPAVPRTVAAAGAPLLYLPIVPRSDEGILAWLGALGAGGVEDGFTQKTLRQWMRKRPGHRSFTVLRHPLVRANDAFGVVLKRPGDADLRRSLRKHYGVPLPEDDALNGLSRETYRHAFRGFLDFVKVNLAGQTGVHPYQIWGTQWVQINAMGDFAPPDLLCREDRLAEDLAGLARSVGIDAPAFSASPSSAGSYPLAEIYDRELEVVAREVYRRDYVTFGFGDWGGDHAA